MKVFLTQRSAFEVECMLMPLSSSVSKKNFLFPLPKQAEDKAIASG